MEWLADAGHACRILTTARFESARDVHDRGASASAGRRCARARRRSSRRSRKKRRVDDRPVVHYAVEDVPVTLLLTRHNDESRPDRAEASAVPGAARRAAGRFRARSADRLQRPPDDPRGDGARADARHHDGVCRPRLRLLRRAATSSDVDHAFTCSQFLTDHYRDKVGPRQHADRAAASTGRPSWRPPSRARS